MECALNLFHLNFLTANWIASVHGGWHRLVWGCNAGEGLLVACGDIEVDALDIWVYRSQFHKIVGMVTNYR